MNASLSSILALLTAMAFSVSALAEEKNGIQYSVQKVTLDRADVRTDLNSQQLDRFMGLRVSLKNVSFKELPEGTITWEILNRKYNSTTIELTSGTEKLQRLKAGENVELTIGSAKVLGYRDGAITRKDELEWQITITREGKEAAKFASKPSFELLRKRAVKVELPNPEPAKPEPPK